MADARIGQGGEQALTAGTPSARIGQGGVAVLGAVGSAARIAQAGVQVLVAPPTSAKIGQAGIEVLADFVACNTRLAQCWFITRTDGEVFAFTSHDQPISFMGQTCTPCNSLLGTATEAATDVGAIGNMELQGVIASDAISEADLYAGRFDGAYVEVWDVPWGEGNPDTPRRLAAGKTGAVSHGRKGFSAEVLGLGAQVQQQSLTQVITPACRFVFGDARCKVPLGPLTAAGTVTGVVGGLDRRTFADAALSGSPGFEAEYFVRGVVTWVTGANAGLRSEVKEYDSATGLFVLWRQMPEAIALADTFTVTPGCDLSADNCKRWANYVNFGGFPDLPGDDAISQTPNARI